MYDFAVSFLDIPSPLQKKRKTVAQTSPPRIILSTECFSLTFRLQEKLEDEAGCSAIITMLTHSFMTRICQTWTV